MPSNLVRLHHTGDTHFITFSCDQRRPLLRTGEARDLVLNALERTRKRYNTLIHGYVVMPEHVHVLLTEPATGTVADVMKMWKLSVTLRSKERPLWEQRYHDFNVYTEGKRTEKLRYLHRNPVTRGLVKNPEDWPWSSFIHYATGCPSPVLLESNWTTQTFDPDIPNLSLSARSSTNSGCPGSGFSDPGSR